MSYFHGVVRLDHHNAQILQFDADSFEAHKVGSHPHETKQHNSEVRTEHEFFGTVCTALDGISNVLVTGGHTALNDFRHYVDKHHPQIAAHVIGWEPVNDPTEGELLAFARQFFQRHGRLTGTPHGV